MNNNIIIAKAFENLFQVTKKNASSPKVYIKIFEHKRTLLVVFQIFRGTFRFSSFIDSIPNITLPSLLKNYYAH